MKELNDLIRQYQITGQDQGTIDELLQVREKLRGRVPEKLPKPAPLTILYDDDNFPYLHREPSRLSRRPPAEETDISEMTMDSDTRIHLWSANFHTAEELQFGMDQGVLSQIKNMTDEGLKEIEREMQRWREGAFAPKHPHLHLLPKPPHQ